MTAESVPFIEGLALQKQRQAQPETNKSDHTCFSLPLLIPMQWEVGCFV